MYYYSFKLDNMSASYIIYYCLFKLFEIILFLCPAFPADFSIRIFILIIYVIGHILGIQTQYKIFKQTTLDAFYHLEENPSV